MMDQFIDILIQMAVIYLAFKAGAWFAVSNLKREFIKWKHQEINSLQVRVNNVNDGDTKEIESIVLEAERKLDLVFMSVEHISDMYYLYTIKNSEFIGQGLTLDALGLVFDKLYPDKNGCIVAGLDTKKWIVKGIIKDTV